MSVSKHTNGGSLHSLFHHVRLFNDIKSEEFADIIAISCSQSSPQNDKVNLLEALAMKANVQISRLQKAAVSIESLQAKITGNALTPEHIEQELSNIGLQSEKATLLKQYIIAQSGSATDSAEQVTHLNSIPSGQLVDMEWKFGVTASSSELDRLGATIVQLKLKVSKQDGSLESLNMELSLTQFYNLLHQLEKAKSSFDYIAM